ncbi:G8 domain-containing protein [Limobrevibacterium gyesilva]|uniref:G8 domain-containing protein n=1 Tax=Limobrevibacterium gyesilva TaxID=2991712 RepID=A0AA42CGN7_9PROT|nr:G8 domain-containing protein [Limobrevibacterium gyesilva]MCW3476266.1 G8 domain-containing protein [Limobrevibacterium gyesilva]
MHTRNDEIDGGLLVEGELEFAGFTTGTVHVTAGATLLLTGTAADLLIEPGGRAIVRGTVSGAVMNGGKVEIHGMVGNVVDTGPAASTQLMPNAVVRGNLL